MSAERGEGVEQARSRNQQSAAEVRRAPWGGVGTTQSADWSTQERATRWEESVSRLAKMEALEEKAKRAGATRRVRAWRCDKCGKTLPNEHAAAECRKVGHPVRPVVVTRRSFECGRCAKRVGTLLRVPGGACPKCGAWAWHTLEAAAGGKGERAHSQSASTDKPAGAAALRVE